MNEFVVRPKIEIKLTQQDIDDIVCAALEGGVNYWCWKVEVVGGKYLGEWASDQISRGGWIRFYDSETEDNWLLTLKKFLNGFRLWVEKGMDHGACADGKVDCCMIDAADADNIVQLALFGDIVFG